MHEQTWLLSRSYVKGNINAVAVITFMREHDEKRKKKKHAPSCGPSKKLKVGVGDDSE